jgi:BRO1-like domain.
MDMRQAMRTPNRDNSGISLLFQYYNQLYFIERRFFPPDRSLGIYFEWWVIFSFSPFPVYRRGRHFLSASHSAPTRVIVQDIWFWLQILRVDDALRT